MTAGLRCSLRTLFLLVLSVTLPANAQVVVSQVYGGGGNSGATLRNDFIELFNQGATPVDLTGWSVQYASSAGTSWSKTTLSGTIAAGGYFLVQEAQGAGGTVDLPTPDAVGTIAMSGTAGKVALVNNSTTLTVSCPSVVDFVGYGSATNCSETAPTANLSNTTAALRGSSGCKDTNNNAADFAIAAPAPRNSATSPNPCSGGSIVLSINDVTVTEGNSGTTTATFTVSLSAPAPAGGVAFDIATADGTATVADADYSAKTLLGQSIAAGSSTYTFDVLVNGDTKVETNETFFVNVTNVTGTGVVVGDAQGLGTIGNDDFVITPIHDIQGSGATSPLAGSAVSTSGIVTGVKSNGFFLQARDANADADPATSEGIFVFTSSAPPASAALGNEVAVSGTVQEFVPSSDPNSPPVTEIAVVTSVVLLTTGNPLPAAVVLTPADTNPAGPIDQLERYEGMRVQVAALNVVGPTSGTISEANATATSNGVFYGVLPGVARPFREPGVQVPDPLPGGAPCCVPRFDANPERIRVDGDGLVGGAALEVTAGATVTNLIGPLDYAFRTYTILPDPGSSPGVSGNRTFTAVPVPDANEFTVASFNLERFFDTTDDPAVSDVVLTPSAFANRLAKASLAIRSVLLAPDILGVEEVENLATLQALAAKVNSDAVAASAPDPQYVAYLVEGNDVGGIDVGFLVKSSRVSVVDVTQYGKDETYVNPNNGLPELLNDRPSLILRANVAAPAGPPFPITVVVNHLRSLSGIDDPVDGNRIRTKRRAQAESLANMLQARQAADAAENLVAIGDFNAFDVNDGYVDVMGTIRGAPAPATEVVLSSGDLVNPNVTDLLGLMPGTERYSFVFDGNAQALDHELVNAALLPHVSRASFARSNADFPESYRNDPNRPERLSDHDVAVAYVRIPAPPQADLAVTAAAPPSASPGAQVAFTLTVQNLGPSDATNVVVTDTLPAAVSLDSCTADAGGVCGGAGLVRTVTFPALAGGASATIVLTGTVLCGTPAGTITNAAAIAAASPSDPNTANDQSHADVLVVVLPPPPPAPIPIDTLPAAGALSPGRVAAAPDVPATVYTWTITNGTITDGQGTSRITYTAGTPGTLVLGVSTPIPGTCFSNSGFANVTVLSAGSAVLFEVVPPCRVVDTRNPTGPLSGPALAPGETRSLPLVGTCGIPAGATSLALNATVVSPAAAGELALYAGDAALPATRNLAFAAGRTRAGSSVVALAGDGSGTVRVTNLSAGAVDLVLDVSGFFR